MTEFVVGAAVLSCGALALALALIICRATNVNARLPVTAEWINDLSIDRYRPMVRLLDGEDLDFLRTQPGFTPRMAARLRTQRAQIFRGYVRCLNADFARVCAAIRILMLRSRRDRPDLAAALVRSQAMFAAGMLLVHIRLLLYGFGFTGVNGTTLVRTFDHMCLELRSLVPATSSLEA